MDPATLIAGLSDAILDLLRGGEMFGPEIRPRLAASGVHMTRAAFYLAIAKLERAGRVTSRWGSKDGRVCRFFSLIPERA